MFRFIERTVHKLFPAQRKAAERAERKREIGIEYASREFSSLPGWMQEDLMKNKSIAALMGEPTKGDERRHADH